jgi:plastocyanin
LRLPGSRRRCEYYRAIDPAREGRCVKIRLTVAAFLGVAVLLGAGVMTSAQTAPARIIKVSMVSFKYDPSIITMNVGERVTLQVTNADKANPGRAHSIASPFFENLNYTVGGDAQQGVAKGDGWKYVLIDNGKTADVTFVPQTPGQYNFLCEQFNHASRGQVGTFIVWPAGYKP